MTEDAERRSEQEEPEIAFGAALRRIDDDLAAGANQITPNALDGQHDRIVGDLQALGRGPAAGKLRRQAAEPDIDDCARAGLPGRNQLRQRDLRAQAEVEAGIRVVAAMAALVADAAMLSSRPDAEGLMAEHDLGDAAPAGGAVELDEHVDRAPDIVADVVAAELGAGLERRAARSARSPARRCRHGRWSSSPDGRY